MERVRTRVPDEVALGRVALSVEVADVDGVQISEEAFPLGALHLRKCMFDDYLNSLIMTDEHPRQLIERLTPKEAEQLNMLRSCPNICHRTTATALASFPRQS